MKFIREASEDEVVFNFLAGEIESDRFNCELKETLSSFNLTETIITNADLTSERENNLRKEILGEFRGYGKNKDLFKNFPKIENYSLYEFSDDDLDNIYYINYSYWNELSSYTSSPIVAANNILKDKTVFDISNEPFLNGVKVLESGKIFPPMILLTYDYKSFIVLEGHSRITIYALKPEYFKNIKCFVLKCSKEDIENWNR